jgi:hypothetical protein
VLRIAVSPVGLEETAASFGEHHSAIATVQWHTLNQPLLFEVAQIGSFVERRIAWIAQVALRHDPKCTDRRERSRVGTVERVIAVALMNQLPLTAVGQVEIAQEDVARVEAAALVVPVAGVAVATLSPVVLGFARVVLCRVVPSFARRRPASQDEPLVLTIANAIVPFT